MTHFLVPLVESDQPVGLRIERTGQWLVHHLDAAFDSATRKRGLLGRDALADGVGFVIAPCQGVHTFGMRFPLDIVGIARDGRVVKVKHAVQPRRIVMAWTAFAILELPAGAAACASLEQGDRVVACATDAAMVHARRQAASPNAAPTVVPGADRSQDAG